jgi:hypothetical protein
VLLAVKQAGIDQDLEVAGDRRLHVERFGQVADAGLAAVGRFDDGQQPEAVRVGEGREELGLIEVPALVALVYAALWARKRFFEPASNYSPSPSPKPRSPR